MNQPSPCAAMDFNASPRADIDFHATRSVPIFDLELMDDIDYSSSAESDESTLEYDDDDVLDRSNAFSAVKRQSLEKFGTRRFDEFGDYVSRSERTRSSVSGSIKLSYEQTICGSDYQCNQNYLEPQRGVRFVHDEDIAIVHYLEPYTRDDIRRCFLNRSEYSEIELECERTETLMVKYQSFDINYDKSAMCFRGLESELSAERRRDLQERHKNAILREELRQRAQNEYINWRKFASVSSKSSSESRTKAVSLGKKDEQCRIEAWGGERRKASKDKPLIPIRRFRKLMKTGH